MRQRHVMTGRAKRLSASICLWIALSSVLFTAGAQLQESTEPRSIPQPPAQRIGYLGGRRLTQHRKAHPWSRYRQHKTLTGFVERHPDPHVRTVNVEDIRGQWSTSKEAGGRTRYSFGRKAAPHRGGHKVFSGGGVQESLADTCTPFLIVKSPRAGSTWLAKELEDQSDVFVKFEPRGSFATAIVDQKELVQKENGKRKNDKPWATSRVPRVGGARAGANATGSGRWAACGASINDFVHTEQRTSEILHWLGRTKDARLVVQLRANVFEKAVSGDRLFNERTRQRIKGACCRSAKARCCYNCKQPQSKKIFNECVHTVPVDPNKVAANVKKGWETIRATLRMVEEVQRRVPGVPVMVLWYEAMVQDHPREMNRVMELLGLPRREFAPASAFKGEHVRNLDAVTALLGSARGKDGPPFKNMLDVKFNEDVDTSKLEKQLLESVKNDELSYGHWK